jgi:hypothetical protein
MLLLPFLLACANPEPAALSTCQALPTLATDAAGLALLEPLLAEADWEALSAAAPTAGLERLGADGLARIRAQTRCTLLSAESAGTGRWAVELERTSPGVTPEGSLSAPETTPLSWQAVKTPDGVRIEAGIAAAAIGRRNAEAAVAEGDLRRAASSWRAIQKKFPDPLLSVDIAQAEDAFAQAEVIRRIRAKPTAVAEGELTVSLQHQGEVPVREIEIRADFGVGDRTESATITWASLEPGSEAELKLPVPEGADGKVHVEIVGLALQGAASAGEHAP